MFLFAFRFAIDLEVTSSVVARLVDGVHSSPRSSPLSLPSTSLGDSSGTTCTLSDDKSQEVIKYHGGWCVVATRQELERSQRADRDRLLSYIVLFGKDVGTLHRPCLENFPMIQVHFGYIVYLTDHLLRLYVHFIQQYCEEV